jgi:hypothetical protein
MASSFPTTVDNDNLVRLASLAEAVSEGVHASAMMRCDTTSRKIGRPPATARFPKRILLSCAAFVNPVGAMAISPL